MEHSRNLPVVHAHVHDRLAQIYGPSDDYAAFSSEKALVSNITKEATASFLRVHTTRLKSTYVTLRSAD